MSDARSNAIAWKRTAGLLLLAAAVATIVVACKPGDPLRSTGAYPIDIFQEQHYNQSFKAQEPPRLAPPEGSMPVQGGRLPVPELKADAAGLDNPVARSPETLDRAALLFQINCSVCHGTTAGGDGFVGKKFGEYGAPIPPAFASDRVKALTQGEAYWSVTSGTGFMPSFAKLLSDEERWSIVLIVTMPEADRAALLARTEAPGG